MIVSLYNVLQEMHSFSMRPSKYFYDEPLPKYLDLKTVLIYRPHPVCLALMDADLELNMATHPRLHDSTTVYPALDEFWSTIDMWDPHEKVSEYTGRGRGARIKKDCITVIPVLNIKTEALSIISEFTVQRTSCLKTLWF